MYIPGRSRTGWRPFRIEMSLAPYATRKSPCEASCHTPSQHAKDLIRGGVFGLVSVPEMGPENGRSRPFHGHVHTRYRNPSDGLVRALAKGVREVSRAR